MRDVYWPSAASSASASGSQIPHLHREVQVDGLVELGAGLVRTAGAAVQLAEAHAAVGAQGTHPQLLGEQQRFPQASLRPRQ